MRHHKTPALSKTIKTKGSATIVNEWKSHVLLLQNASS